MDDFSFPTVAFDPDSLCQLPFPHFAASPLWFLSSVSDPKPARRRRSFSSAEDAYTQREEFASPAACHLNSPALSDEGNRRRFLEDEEKMDMLWEDFNEELAQFHRRQPPKDYSGAGRDVALLPRPGADRKSKKGSKRAKAELRSSPVLAMAKSNSLIHHRRSSVVVMFKLLKRLFLVQNPRCSRKTQHCDEQDPPAPQ